MAKIHIEFFWVVIPCNVVVGYKHWYPTTTLHGVAIQKNTTRMEKLVIRCLIQFRKGKVKRRYSSIYKIENLLQHDDSRWLRKLLT